MIQYLDEYRLTGKTCVGLGVLGSGGGSTAGRSVLPRQGRSPGQLRLPRAQGPRKGGAQDARRVVRSQQGQRAVYKAKAMARQGEGSDNEQCNGFVTRVGCHFGDELRYRIGVGNSIDPE